MTFGCESDSKADTYYILDVCMSLTHVSLLNISVDDMNSNMTNGVLFFMYRLIFVPVRSGSNTQRFY